MRPADKHLTPQELDLLLLNPADSRDSNASGALSSEARQHLNGCMYCQSVAEKCRKAEEALRNLRTWSRTSGGGKALAPGSDCPPEDTWSVLAAGLMEDEKAALFVTHAATCGWCGPRLKEAMRDLAEDITAEEQEALAQLPTASPGWQRAMAQKLATASGNPDVPLVKVETPAGSKEHKSKEKAGFGWWPKLVWAGSGLAVVVVAVLVGVRLTREPDVNALLAQAYTEQRTIELRISGAAFAQLRHERGRHPSAKPTALVDAEYIIRHKLEQHSDDAAWLDKKGQAELLGGDYNSAIITLNDAKNLDASPEIKTDLATGYFERAEGDGSSADYPSALQLLTEVLQQKPDDRIALFNRAIVYERMLLPREAVKDWEKYLALPGKDDWKQEAAKHLQDVQEKLKRGYDHNTELMDYVTFAQTISPPNDLSWQPAESRIEDYLESAIRDWLPASLSARKPEARLKALQALKALAAVLVLRHGDYWLQDVLVAPASPGYTKAILLLGETLNAERTGNPEKAARKAMEADVLFRAAGNTAGSNRARAELAYALHRSVQGRQCEKKAGQLVKQLDTRSPWLTGYVLTEYSVCAGMVGHLNKSQLEIAKAIAVAQQASYPQLYLRALGMAASLDTAMGRPNAAWDKDRAGLDICWRSSYSPQRAYQFYSDLGFLPEKTGSWFVAMALAREAVAEAIRTKNPATVALARFRLASAASAAGSQMEAIEQFEAAEKIYKEELPDDSTMLAYRLEGQISLAELKILNGERDVPLQTLAAAEGRLAGISDYPISLRLHVVLGELYSREASWRDARAEYTKAVLKSEDALSHIQQEAERLRWDRETKQAYRGLLKSYLQQTNDTAQALEFWEWYKAAASRPSTLKELRVSEGGALLLYKTGAAPVQVLDSIRPSLKNEVVISYAQLPDEIISWAFDDRTVSIKRIPVSAAEFDLTATRFLNQCSDPQSSIEALRVNGRKLYDWLIAPQISNLSPDRQLTIEPDGAIMKVPFAALVDENGKYLAERFAIAFSIGAHYRGGRPMDHALLPHQKALIVASPALTSKTGLSPLPEALQEANAVASCFHNPLRLTGAAATREAVERALGNAEIFHYVGHSYGNFGSVGLLLAGDRKSAASEQEPEILTAEHISRLKLRRLRLVVLSSCSTESNPDQVLTDPDELVRAFLQADAKQVIASRWSVDSQATAQLMERFYGNLFSTGSPAWALQLASDRIRKHTGSLHPYFWASFYCFS